MILNKSRHWKGYQYKCKCDICGKIFTRKATWVKRTKHQFCDQICASKYKSIEISGEKNSNWRGGKSRHGDGYMLIYNPDHPFSGKRGYVMEHRLVMEEFLGRYLLPEEVVHHENGVRDDNRIENLKLFKNIAEHKRYHKEMRLSAH